MQTATRKNETILQWMYARNARLGRTAQGKCQPDRNIGFLINVRGRLRQVTVGAATNRHWDACRGHNDIYLILLIIACATRNLRIGVGARQRALTYPQLLRADRADFAHAGNTARCRDPAVNSLAITHG